MPAIVGSMLGALALVVMLLVSLQPAVEPQHRPTARNVLAGRQVIAQFKRREEGKDGVTSLILDDAMIRGLAALVSDASGYKRLNAGVESGVFRAEASLAMPLGLWLNSSLSVSGTHRGFPDCRLRIGKVALPFWASRAAAEVARWVIRFKGTLLPPLDLMVRSMKIGEGTVRVELALPKRRALFERVIQAKGTKVDERLLVAIACRLAVLQRRRPADELSVHVRRAFGTTSAAKQAEYNRAAFVALSLFVVGSEAEPLAGQAAKRARRCAAPARPILLSGRADLAKHWTLSAALGAVLGHDPAAALGEWKELSDSLASGSGFSFRDLAADRSGLHFARRGVHPDTAAVARLRLAQVSDRDLFPLSLIAAQEGLSEEAFIARYGTIEAGRYDETVKWIDRQLERVRGR